MSVIVAYSMSWPWICTVTSINNINVISHSAFPQKAVCTTKRFWVNIYWTEYFFFTGGFIVVKISK